MELGQFVQYMVDMDMEALGSNCANVYYKHPQDPNGVERLVTRAGDRIMCKLMSGALFFLYQSNATAKIQGIDHTNDETLREYVRCAILNMFAKFLKQSACDGKWGLWYAWYTVEREMDESMGGVMKRVNCANEVYQNIQAAGWSMEQKIATWLSTDHKLKDRLGKAGVSNICKWELDKDGHIKGRKGTAHVDNTTHMIATNVTKPLTEGIKEILVDIKKEVKETIQRGLHTQQAPGVQGVQTPSPSPPGRSDHGSGESSGSAPAISGANEPATTPSKVPTGAGGASAAKPAPKGTGTQGPGAGQQPPSPPPQQPENTSTSNTGAAAPDTGTGSTTPDKGKEGVLCNEDKDESSIRGPKPTVQADPIDYNLRGHGSVTMVIVTPELPKKCPGNGSETKVDSTESATKAKGPQPPPQKSDISVQDNTREKGASVSTKQENKPVDDTGKDGSTDPASTSPEEKSGHSANPAGGETGSTAHDTDGLGSVHNSSNLWAIGSVPSGDNKADGKGGGPPGLEEYGSGIKCNDNPSDKRCDPQFSITFKPDATSLGGGYGTWTPRDGLNGQPAQSGNVPGPQDKIPGETTDGSGPYPPDLTADILTATTPVLFFLASVIVALLGYSLWKYFAFLGKKRRRTYRTVRDVPSPPLHEDILQHLQRGELPPPDYGYTMVRATRAASTSERRGQRPPRVNRRTILELHLEVLNECEATEWEHVKEHYLQIVVEEFANNLMRDDHRNNTILDVPNSHAALATHDATTRNPPTDIDATNPLPPNEDDPDAWSCMETIQFATARSPPNEDDPDPWSCMETIQFDAPQSRAHSNPEHATPDHTNWINWIHRNTHLLRACTGKTWFNALKTEWKQYLREHMVANEDNAVYGHRQFGQRGNIPSVEMKKDAWNEWVEQQHRQMSVHSDEAWFQHLLHTAQEETESQNGQAPIVDKELEVEQVMAAAHVLRVRDLPRSQPPHEQYYQQKHLIAKLWMLLLASVIEECEVERSVQDRELYVDELLQQL
ncbi:hypothetical protein AK88_04618 [Plasmodium fragile]|uniref:Schizont-infected cell agglutination C-terminal domain-containing protein n=1 Tax=Plasmodium fragile TaxID=5857 RepID=A0A0D9QFJ1_PLAFR|nr:uncharacterized protein AK88_04618 [Plasmodium fragile]KJP85748.1 hypothetical protein AK88_04618 [Plasmodium fragile]